MDSIQMLMHLICAFAGIISYQLYHLMFGYIDLYKKRKTFASLENVNSENVCKSSHKWDRIKLAMHDIPFGEYLVCTECGFVPSSGSHGPLKKLNKPALEIYKNHLLNVEKTKLRLLEYELKKNKEVHKIMNSMIKSLLDNPDYHKQDLNTKVELLQQFFRKSVIELEALYSTLNKEFDNEK